MTVADADPGWRTAIGAGGEIGLSRVEANATGRAMTAALPSCGSGDRYSVGVNRRFPGPNNAGRSVSDPQEGIYELTTQTLTVRRAPFQLRTTWALFVGGLHQIYIVAPSRSCPSAGAPCGGLALVGVCHGGCVEWFRLTTR